MPMPRRCTGVPARSCPFSRMLPACPVSRPATSLSRVDFPEPLGPITASSSPVSTCIEMPCTLPGAWIKIIDGVKDQAHWDPRKRKDDSKAATLARISSTTVAAQANPVAP